MTYADLSPDLQDEYDWLDEESKQAELEWDDQVLRFKKDPVIDFLWANRMVDLNILAVAAMKHKWPLKYMMRFYRGLGYSLSGFGDIFHEERMERGHF